MCGHTRNPVIYSKFHRNPFRGFGDSGGQNLAFPITLASRFYNNLYYRTIRETPFDTVCKASGILEWPSAWHWHLYWCAPWLYILTVYCLLFISLMYEYSSITLFSVNLWKWCTFCNNLCISYVYAMSRPNLCMLYSWNKYSTVFELRNGQEVQGGPVWQFFQSISDFCDWCC